MAQNPKSRQKRKTVHESKPISKTVLSRFDRMITLSNKDQRHDFQRDRDRLLHSHEFRRLAGVTQVVHVAEGHVFHNRLTHSLKVAQIGRRIAEHLLNTTKPEVINSAGGLDPDVVETAALAHDIGHPPFGHVTEEELDKLLKEQNCTDGFEGNAQSFRILTQLSIRNSSEPGLNLTRASLNAVLKYPWPRGTTEKEKKKWGFYTSESAHFDFARALSSLPKQKSLEAEIMDLSDDIAYSVHDVDDFYRAGIVPLDRLLNKSEERARFIEAAIKKLKKDDINFTKNEAHTFFDNIAVFVRPITEPFNGSKEQYASLSYFNSFLIMRFAFDKKLKPLKVRAKASSGMPLVIDRRVDAEIKFLKYVMSYYVYNSPALIGQQTGQRKVIREIFNILRDAIVVKDSVYADILPEPFRDYVKQNDGDKVKNLRVIADFIASLTEQQTLNLHRRLTGVEPGSITNL